MVLELDASDVVILSLAAACCAAAILIEALRFVIPEIYEWVAGHDRVRLETVEARKTAEALLIRNREQAALRDRRNTERFRLKASLGRVELALAAVEKERIEIWHDLGDQTVADTLFLARVTNRQAAEKAQRDFDLAPFVWRYTNNVRIWAVNDKVARAYLEQCYPKDEGYAWSEPVPASAAAAVAGAAPASSFAARTVPRR
ncbi:MAG TPA: hypothetical protein VED40_00590 [Azospirillaceae bacterium]|nr:hypothetical protein [Azospirillaceae bacterium]